MMLGGLKKKLRYAGCFFLAVSPALAAVSSANAETSYASIARKNSAVGHYARARALLVDALAEFEQGRKYARPDMLLDPEEWRLSVISRTEELNRILDPKPKVTRDGVRFQANKLLIRREKDRVPDVEDGAASSNVVGEVKSRAEKRQARARMEIPDEDEPVKVIPKSAVKETTAKETTVVKETVTKEPVAAKSAEDAISFPAEPEAEPETAVQNAPAKQAEAAPAPTASKLIIDDEEVVTTKQVEKPKTPTVVEEDEAPIDEDAAAARQAAGGTTDRLDLQQNNGPAGEDQSLEQKEDEVTKEIERAIQDRISKEKAPGGGDVSLGNDDDE